MVKKQSVTATSTCDAKYVAAAACTWHATWLCNLLLCLGFPQSGPTSIYCNNQATISLTKDFQFHAKLKHIDIHVHLICDKVSNLTILVSYVLLEEIVANIFTKGLAWIKHEKFVCGTGSCMYGRVTWQWEQRECSLDTAMVGQKFKQGFIVFILPLIVLAQILYEV